MAEVYSPSEDSYFFADFLKYYLSKNKIKSFLEIGTGSGILAEVALIFLDGKKILATDIKQDAVVLAKEKNLNAIKSNLFSKVHGKFDLIIFNAPYLPKDAREPKDSQIATTGGKKGDEISVKFLKQAKNHLTKDGRILLLVSSLTPQNKIKEFKPKIIAKKKVFAEEFLILEFYNNL